VLLSTAGTENDSAVAGITMTITGQSSVASAGVVKCNGFIVDAYN
jgi:hypothetical protein